MRSMRFTQSLYNFPDIKKIVQVNRMTSMKVLHPQFNRFRYIKTKSWPLCSHDYMPNIFLAIVCNLFIIYHVFRRCITLRYTVPVPILSYRFDKLPKLAKTLLKLLHDRAIDDHPIIFHSFSNGGTIFYNYISLEMQKQNKMLQVIVKFQKLTNVYTFLIPWALISFHSR